MVHIPLPSFALPGVLAGFLLASCSEPMSGVRGDASLLRESACENCEIQLIEIAELGSDQDPSSISADAMVFPCGATSFIHNRFAVSRLTGGGEVGVYGSSGARAGAIGRAGEGPGELGRDLRVLPVPGTGLAVIDNGNYRVAVFDTSGAWVSGFRIPGRAMSHAMLDGRLLIHTRPTVGQGSDELFHIYDLTGSLLKSFGDADPGLGELDQWIVSRASSGGFFTASIWSYEFWSWVAPDSLRRHFIRSAEWFPRGGIKPGDLDGLYVESPPPPVLTHILDPGDGLLWIFVMLPDRNWRKATPEAVTPEWTQSTLDMMIEVVDPASASVVATLRHDEVLAPMCNGETLYAVRRAPSGDTRLVVLKPQLAGWPE